MIPRSIRATIVAMALCMAGSGGVLAEISGLEIIAPSGAGGGWDQTARAVQTVMQEEKIASGVQVVNVPGAGGTIGLAQFVTSKKGRANALMVGGFTLISAVITNKSPVSLADVTPLARLTGEYEAVAVPATSDIKSLQDLVAKLRADPGSVSWAGGSLGSTDHVCAALIAEAAGVDPTKVNYVAHAGGGEAMTSLLGGHVTVGVSGWGEFGPQVLAGKLRILGMAAPERVKGVDAPTLKEQGIDVELANWRGVFAPPGLSKAKLDGLATSIDQLAKSDRWHKLVESRGWLDSYLPHDQFVAFIGEQQTRMDAMLQKLGLAPH